MLLAQLASAIKSRLKRNKWSLSLGPEMRDRMHNGQQTCQNYCNHYLDNLVVFAYFFKKKITRPCLKTCNERGDTFKFQKITRLDFMTRPDTINNQWGMIRGKAPTRRGGDRTWDELWKTSWASKPIQQDRFDSRLLQDTQALYHLFHKPMGDWSEWAESSETERLRLPDFDFCESWFVGSMSGGLETR